VITSGAVIRGVLFHLHGRREPVAEIGRRIGASLARVLARAKAENRSPAAVARDEADERIACARDS
jgi:hypothetical protein